MSRKASKQPDRTLPHAPEAEQAILGAILNDNKAIPLVRVVLKSPKPFYDNSHRTICETIFRLNDAHQPADITTVGTEIQRRGEIKDCGGLTYLSELATGMATSANISYYCKLVMDDYSRREMIDIAADISKRCYDRQDTPTEILDSTITTIFSARSKSAKTGPVRMSELAVPMVEEITAIQKGEKTIGLQTPFDRLNEKTGGFSAGLIILGGFPSMGKTAMAVQLAHYIAANDGPAYFRSIETSKEQLALRHYCTLGQVNSLSLKVGRAGEAEYTSFAQAINDKGSENLFIDDNTESDIHTVIADIYAAKNQHDIRIAFIDHLQLITSDDRKKRHEQLAYYCKLFVRLWRELEIPIVLLCQLTARKGERRNSAPRLEHLRGSGDIGQDADLVLMLHRPEVNASKKDLEKRIYDGIAELYIRKQRNGPVGKIELDFVKSYTLFQDRPQLTAF